MEMACTHDSNKRTRLSPGPSSSLDIADLPEGAWSLVAGYLPKPSVALFAAALTAPSAAWRDANWQLEPCELSRAILSSIKLVKCQPAKAGDPWRGREGSWEVLDFGEIASDQEEEEDPNSLAWKMSDDDLGAALACIDAKTQLKRIKIEGRVSITGRGLEPLRSSTALEQMDLYKVDHSSANFSDEVVVPILESFIFHSPLKQLRLPRKWCKEADTPAWEGWGASSRLVDGFVQRYIQHLESFPFDCAGHADPNTCEMDNGYRWVERWSHYGWQNFTCYSCLRNCCRGSPIRLSKCFDCLRCFCGDCDTTTSRCQECGKSVCAECEAESGACDCCNAVSCGVCLANDACSSCERRYCRRCAGGSCSAGCGKRFCRDCYEDTDIDEVTKACSGDDCGAVMCEDCDGDFQRCNVCHREFCGGIMASCRTRPCAGGCDQSICSECVAASCEYGGCDTKYCGTCNQRGGISGCGTPGCNASLCDGCLQKHVCDA